MEVGDAGDCSGEVGEVERGGLFEVESEAYAEEAEESVTADRSSSGFGFESSF